MGESSPSSDAFNFVVVVLFAVDVSPKIKKNDWGMGGWGLANPSFSRIYGLFQLDNIICDNMHKIFTK